jgi:hypothetical protein
MRTFNEFLTKNLFLWTEGTSQDSLKVQKLIEIGEETEVEAPKVISKQGNPNQEARKLVVELSLQL